MQHLKVISKYLSAQRSGWQIAFFYEYLIEKLTQTDNSRRMDLRAEGLGQANYISTAVGR